MRRFGIIGVYLFALAAWAQLLAPALAARMSPTLDPLTVICATPSSDGGSSQGGHHSSPAHQCCVLCHAYLGGAPLDASPAYTAFDYPISSPLRWRDTAVAPRSPKLVSRHRSRGPPTLV